MDGTPRKRVMMAVLAEVTISVMVEQEVEVMVEVMVEEMGGKQRQRLLTAAPQK